MLNRLFSLPFSPFLLGKGSVQNLSNFLIFVVHDISRHHLFPVCFLLIEPYRRCVQTLVTILHYSCSSQQGSPYASLLEKASKSPSKHTPLSYQMKVILDNVDLMSVLFRWTGALGYFICDDPIYRLKVSNTLHPLTVDHLDFEAQVPYAFWKQK